jgi:P2-related tail formation protein
MTKSLLPPNSTVFEKAIENVVKLSVNTGLLKGFKFKDNSNILSYLVWEYNLNDVLEYVKDGDIIVDGLVFQRTRGTKAAIKIAANWAGLNDVDIYEEPPSTHFYEFQIGVKNRQFDFDIELLRNVISLAKPVRSRLSRVYNDIYDIRYFKLDDSEFGNILSDNSGVKLDDLTLSFGRKQAFETMYTGLILDDGITRIHEIKSAADRIYRLDFVVLGETEPDINAIQIEYQKVRIYENFDSICEGNFEIDKYLKFSKASVILSEDSVLEDINSCFCPRKNVEKGMTFELGKDALSEHFWRFETNEILERFANDTTNYSDISNTEYVCSEPVLVRVFIKIVLLENIITLANARDSNVSVAYETNPYWHEHQHLERPWNDGVCDISLQQLIKEITQ